MIINYILANQPLLLKYTCEGKEVKEGKPFKHAVLF